MKTLNKKLLSTAALLIGLCCLTSFNPLSLRYAYNDVEGSVSLSATMAPTETAHAVLTATEAVPDGRSQAPVGKNANCSIYESRHDQTMLNKYCRGNNPEPKSQGRDSSHSGQRSHKDGDGNKNVAANYTIDPTQKSITVNNAKKSENTISFSVPEGIAIIDSITTKNGKTMNSSSKVIVRYHVISDTEADVAAKCTDCRAEARELAKKLPFELDSDKYNFSDLVTEMRSGTYGDQMKLIEQGIIDHPHSSLDAKSVQSMRSDDDDVASADEKQCTSSNFSELVSCYRGILKKTNKRKDEDTYNRIMGEVSDLADEEAFADRPKAAHLKKLRELARGDKETLTHIDAASTYVTNINSVKQYKSLLRGYAQDAAALDQQIAQLGNCNTMNVQMNWNCNMLTIAKSQIVMQAQRDVGGLQNRFRTSLSRYEGDDNVDSFRESLGSTYDDFLEPYKNLISSDPKLMSLDTPSVVPSTPTQSWNPQNAAQQNSITGLNNGLPMQQNNPRYNPNLTMQPGAQFAAQPNQSFYQPTGIGSPSPSFGNGQSWHP